MKRGGREWLRTKGPGFLRRAGLKEGQTVLDFGCNEGSYVVPAATVVGKAGTVYALDKDGQALKVLRKTLSRNGCDNVECLHVAEDGRLPLANGSVDAVLLYDVLHGGYFPEPDQRLRILRSIYRVLKPQGVLSFYPTHLRKYGMTFHQAVSEVQAVGFTWVGQSRRRLVHDGHLTRGWVLTFRR
jgi:ubiquinone/menaquinone biosynthesis C-methylase UbiE